MLILKNIIALCAFIASAATAQALDAPQGRILLTVEGGISTTNAAGKAEFDLTMLSQLPATEFTTTTIWTDGPQVFRGVSLHLLLDQLDVQGTQIKASAINDYHVMLPVADAKPGGPIIAYERNGAIMSIRDKGPLWIVYPFDLNADYQTEVIYARSIWQLDRLQVIP